jgi:pyruvate formate lyase activating enzyme
MMIFGLQKMTLLDFPGHVACTVFLGGCDFRCPFCHNFDLACGKMSPVMDEDEFFGFLGKRKGLLDGVAITGGEPLLHQGIDIFIRRIRDMGYLVKLDTNGYHPEMLKKLADEKLVDYIAMDIKNSPEKYAKTSGLDVIDMEKIKTSIGVIMNSHIPYEFRTTVTAQLHSASDFEEIGKLIQGADAYYLQQFVSRETVPDNMLSAPTPAAMQSFLEISSGYVKSAQVRGL